MYNMTGVHVILSIACPRLFPAGGKILHLKVPFRNTVELQDAQHSPMAFMNAISIFTPFLFMLSFNWEICGFLSKSHETRTQ
jgi:hypothetical protein